LIIINHLKFNISKGKKNYLFRRTKRKKLNIEILKEYADGHSIEVEVTYGTTEYLIDRS
jgi:hypothetical protein